MFYKLRDWIPIDFINWKYLSSNPNALFLLKSNPNKINWKYLSMNPNAIDLLKENQDKINWKYLSANPAIFEYDYKTMKETRMKQPYYNDIKK